MWLFQLVLLLHDVSSKEIRVIFKRDMLEGGISVDFEVSLWMIIQARSWIHYIPEESYFFFFCFFFFLIVRRESKWNIRFYCWMGDGDDEGCPSLNCLVWLPSVFKSKKLCVCVCVLCCVVLQEMMLMAFSEWCKWNEILPLYKPPFLLYYIQRLLFGCCWWAARLTVTWHLIQKNFFNNGWGMCISTDWCIE